MRTALVPFYLIGTLTLAACGPASATVSAPQTTASAPSTVAAPPTTAVEPVTPEPAAPPTARAAPMTSKAAAVQAAPAPVLPSSWSMPNLVGKNLQAAQDSIQALTADGIFYTSSHDATGAGRQQVLDRNWKVCTQSVKPGAKITKDSLIDFGAAKLAESC